MPAIPVGVTFSPDRSAGPLMIVKLTGRRLLEVALKAKVPLLLSRSASGANAIVCASLPSEVMVAVAVAGA